MATVSKWNPYGVSLNITATGGTVKRTSATKYTVEIDVSWETYYSGNQTNYGMSATSGGVTKTISSFGTKRSSGSSSFTGTYSISGNGSATKTITVTFKNYEEDWQGNITESATKAVTFNVTVPAWTSYKITYNANGGSGAPSAQTKWKDQTLTLSSTKPTRTGYSFQGWATSSSATSATYSAGGSYTANSAATLYAVWKANTYTVKYDANGGTGAPGNQTKTYGKTLTLSSTKPTRANYNFKGWGTSASATTVAYAAGASYTANAAVTLYAVWELAYQKPKISGVSVSRCNSSGTKTENGTYALVRFSFLCEKSPKSIVVSWASSDASGSYSYTGFSDMDIGWVTDTGNLKIGNGTLSTEKTYTITITVTDAGGSTSVSRTINSLKFNIDCLPENKGVAIGKAAELEDTLDVGFKARFRDSVQFDKPAEARANLKAWCFDDTTNSSYAGLARPDGTTTGWMRTTQTGLLPYEQGGNSSSIGSSSWQFKNGYFKNLYADGNDILNGSGWKTATLTSDFKKYDDKDDNMPQYIKIGKLVQVRGAVSPTSTITGSADAYTIFTLPEGYRPSKQVSILSPGSGSNQWLLTITAAGAVRFARYNNGAGYVNASSSTWLTFHAMYFVD